MWNQYIPKLATPTRVHHQIKNVAIYTTLIILISFTLLNLFYSALISLSCKCKEQEIYKKKKHTLSIFIIFFSYYFKTVIKSFSYFHRFCCFFCIEDQNKEMGHPKIPPWPLPSFIQCLNNGKIYINCLMFYWVSLQWVVVFFF